VITGRSSNVDWDDARAYARWLAAMKGTSCRLPSEAEWEYAARAGTTTRFSYGDDPHYAEATNYMWELFTADLTVHPVGLKLPNPWGLYDMHGNVWEWCQDHYGNYSSDMVSNPKGPTTGSYRTCRGGSWYDAASSVTSAYRSKNLPHIRVSYLGFRLVYVPSE
jgi:formylglycine-generating enzyme required for sulfatase activity